MSQDVYAELGVKKIINAAGTYTMVGGSRMSERTLEAMAQAARSHVVIRELQEKVHARLATVTRNEAAFVTNGAACALHIVGAAAIAKHCDRYFSSLSPERIAGCEIVIHRAHRNPYDWAIRLLGAELVEIGFPNTILPTAISDLELAITANTCAIYYFYMPAGGWMPPGALTLEQTLDVAKKHNLPVLVDAAAQLPPVENLWTITGKGASACIFSGGKDLKGPQASGLVVGKRDFMQWVEATAFPTYGVGRMFKVGREEIVGLWSAVEEYVVTDHVVRSVEADAWVTRLQNTFNESPVVTVERVYPNEAGQPIPQAIVRFRTKKTLEESIASFASRHFADGCPSIFTIEAGEDGLFVNPMTLRENEIDTIIKRIFEIEKSLM